MITWANIVPSDLPPAQILVVDDDPDIRTILNESLRSCGYKVLLAENGERAITLARTHSLDLAILDIMLPKCSGLDLLSQIKLLQPGIEIIMLTALDRAVPTKEALRNGAFDYIVKFPPLQEILAVVQRALKAKHTQNQIQIGDLVVDTATKQMTLTGQPLHLSPLEEELLMCLLRQRGLVTTYDMLWHAGWAYDTLPDKDLIQRTVNRLRQKIGKEKVVVVRKQGYILV